ncbi:MAG: ParA family protein [Clostridia bacterium]
MDIIKKIIAFTNQKGGVGKTTTCINLASVLALGGYSVLIVDMDPQGNCSSGVGVVKNTTSIYDVIVGKKSINDASIIRKTCVENLDIIPAGSNLAGAEVELVNIKAPREYVLKTELAKLEKEYNFIFIDCPPSLSLLTVNALTCCDSIFIPIQCEFFALEGLSQLIYTVKQVKQYLNSKIFIEGIVLNMFDNRSNLTRQVENEIVKYFNEKLYITKIPRNIRLAEAPSHGMPVAVYDSKCTGAKAYFALGEEFINRQCRRKYGC